MGGTAGPSTGGRLDQARGSQSGRRRWHRKLAAEFGEAERALARLREEAKTASENDQRARARLSQVSARIGELDALLEGAPSDEQITERLALLKRLEAAADQAETVLDAAAPSGVTPRYGARGVGGGRAEGTLPALGRPATAWWLSAPRPLTARPARRAGPSW